jgi:hypothetical protein
MSIFSMIAYIKQYYRTLNGKQIEDCGDKQIIAVYYSLLNRQHKKLHTTRYS